MFRTPGGHYAGFFFSGKWANVQSRSKRRESLSVDELTALLSALQSTAPEVVPILSSAAYGGSGSRRGRANANGPAEITG